MAELDQIIKALRLVPEFDGNVNVLTRFIHLCDQLIEEFRQRNPENKLVEVALINGILNKVTGSAARLINSNGIPTEWVGIRKALINNFSDQRDETALYNDLALLTQGSGTPQEFYERCQNIFSTLMTYVSLHENVSTTIEAKRDLYKKLTLQAYLRGLKDPLGSRIRCMRPETIEKALEYVHEEQNTLYLQHRNENISDKRSQPQAPTHFKGPPTHNYPPAIYKPPSYNNNFNMPGPSKPFAMPTSPPQWRPNNHHNQTGPTRTMQIFRAAPPNYNQQNAFRFPPRNSAPPVAQQQPKPMSGVSHYATRTLPPMQFVRAHDWSKQGNPPPSNYFKTREMNFNDMYYTYDDYYDYGDYYYGLDYDYTDYDTHGDPQVETVTQDNVTPSDTGVTIEDFQDPPKSEKPK